MPAQIRNIFLSLMLMGSTQAIWGAPIDRPLLSHPAARLDVEAYLIEDVVERGEPLVFVVRVRNTGSLPISIDQELFNLIRGNIRFYFYDEAPATHLVQVNPFDGFSSLLSAFASGPRRILESGEKFDDFLLLWGREQPFTRKSGRIYVTVSGTIYGLVNGAPYQSSFVSPKLPFSVNDEIPGYDVATAIDPNVVNYMHVSPAAHNQCVDYISRFPHSSITPYFRLILSGLRNPQIANAKSFEQIALDRNAPLGVRYLADDALTVINSKKKRSTSTNR